MGGQLFKLWPGFEKQWISVRLSRWSNKTLCSMNLNTLTVRKPWCWKTFGTPIKPRVDGLVLNLLITLVVLMLYLYQRHSRIALGKEVVRKDFHTVCLQRLFLRAFALCTALHLHTVLHTAPCTQSLIPMCTARRIAQGTPNPKTLSARKEPNPYQ